jgi:hypothetical protein
VLITGPGVELGLGPGFGPGFCAKARNGEMPIAVVAVALRKPRRVALAKDQLPSPDRMPIRRTKSLFK